MSAYILSNSHIDALLTYAQSKLITFYIDGMIFDARKQDDINKIGQILVNTNHESVNERYNENDLADEYKFRFDFQHSHMKAVQVLKACGCYDYQACEIKNYLMSLACKIIQTIRMEAIHNLPGYSDAEWSIDN